MILDLSLKNEVLYAGLDIVTEGGKRNLRTPPADAIPRIAANLESIEIDAVEVVLTGSMAIWAYLVVFHALHGRTRRIYYQDGVGNRLLVAAHG
ncbi:MAG TPA: hypothetical protein VGJ81_00840 [Thermoanaerobaculia bacterium]|jgi:hypothetical protein